METTSTLAGFGENLDLEIWENTTTYTEELMSSYSRMYNVFESFRRVSLENYGLDPSHFYTAPGLAWKACLKKTGIRLELLLDPDMLLMFERGIRGGITQSVHRWAAANNPYMGSEYDKSKPTKYLQYLAANNL